MMINFVNVSKSFGTRKLFSNFSFDLPKNGLVVIVGESGSGKSTMLNLINGIDNCYDGQLFVCDKEIRKMSKRDLNDFRLLKIGYVFQNFNLINSDTVFNNLLLPLDACSNSKFSHKRQRILDCLRLVDLKGYQNHYVNRLSGGEKQRIAIARSIINDPPILLCDEPTGSLDESNSLMVFQLLKKISSKKLVVVATHDIDLAKKFADVTLKIKEEKIVVKRSEKKKENKEHILFGSISKKKKQSISLRYKVLHSIQKMKSKKYRSIITNIVLSLSLTGIGLSVIITDSVSTKVNDAFAEILNGNQIIVSRKIENDRTFSSSYSASFNSINSIYEKYKYHLDGIGVNYFVNFEDFFRDNNYFYTASTSKKIIVPSLSARSINDFRWCNNDSGRIYYPFNVGEIDDDQIILGLSYTDMINLCYQLQIQRNYTSLGHFIYEKGLMIAASLRNNNWQYDDEQIFNVVAVCESNTTCFYHTNLLWNEYVFEDCMMFPGDDNEEHVFPWEMYKTYYLITKEDPGIFINKTMYDENMDDFVFERSNFNYHPYLCKAGSVCDEKRVYVYATDKFGISPSFVERIKEESSFSNNYYFTSDYGYSSYASNIFSGFSKNVFISNSDENINKAIDADTQLTEQYNLAIDLPQNVIQGNFLKSLAGGLRFSTRMDELLFGRKPTNLNEIVISKGVSDTFDKNELYIGKYLSFAGETSEYKDAEGFIEKEYSKTKLLVVGITNETKNYIYHNCDWSTSFFRDKLGISSFLLIPTSIVFEYENKDVANEEYQKLKVILNECKISNPLEDLSQNIDSTLEYANTILVAFSVLATIISILLLWVVLILEIVEGKDEFLLFKYIGLNSKNINSIITYQGITKGVLAFLISTLELTIIDIIISIFISDYLNIGFTFSLNFKPIFIIFSVGFILPYLISKITLFYFSDLKKT